MFPYVNAGVLATAALRCRCVSNQGACFDSTECEGMPLCGPAGAPCRPCQGSALSSA